jgi:DNA-binding transcriptional LysR family regulator
MQDLNWNDLRFVLAVARGKSLAAAARSMEVNESTVARRITQSEHQLAAQLFERNSGRLNLTKAGELVVAGAERVELETQNLQAAVSGTDQLAAGVVRLTAVPIVLNHILVPALSDLSNTHPDLTIELIAEPRDLSLSKRESDIALRLARPSKEAKILARRIGKLDYAVYTSVNTDPNKLPWIIYEDSMRDLPQAHWLAEQINQSENAATVMGNDAEVILACIKAGLGKSLLPIAVGDLDPDLVRINSVVPLSREIWMMVHPDIRQLTRIKVVVDWLISVVEKL